MEKIIKKLKTPIDGDVFPPENKHQRIYEELCAALRAMPKLRGPGVKDNLFRLSDYVSKKADVPSREVLTFLHAYIFALEHTVYYQAEEIERLKKAKADYAVRPTPPFKKARPLPDRFPIRKR